MQLQNNQSTSMFEERFIREQECREITGLSRTSRYEMEQEGRFPKRLKLNKRTVAWKLSDIRQWMKDLENEQ